MSLCLRYLAFQISQRIVMPSVGVRWTPTGIKRARLLPDSSLCSRYLSSQVVARQVLSAQMSLTSVFGMGSDGSAACGGRSDLSEWQRSARSKLASPSAASAGHRNRKQVEPVPRHKKNPTTEVVRFMCSRYLFSRPVTRQLSSAQMSLTSVFGMGTGGPSS